MNAILQSLLGIPPFVQDLSNKVLLGSVHPQCLYKLVQLLLYSRINYQNISSGVNFLKLLLCLSDVFTMLCYVKVNVGMLKYCEIACGSLREQFQKQQHVFLDTTNM